MAKFRPLLERVRQAGLGLTLHIAETRENTTLDTNTLLASNPSRLGHATFLDEAEQKTILDKKIPVEICLSSNLM
jgi:adenosine deaminase